MIPYIGGKAKLATWIIDHFPADHLQRHYIEVFGGGGWVLFKKEPAYIETYNDLNSDLVNLFTMLRDRYPELEHRAQWTLHSREMYQEAMRALREDAFLDDLDRALNYLIARKQTFAGKQGETWAYAVTPNRITSGQWLPFLRRMDLINARLKRVQIEHLDFERLIKKYDGPGALFYCDPPYYLAEHYYKNAEVDFTEADHTRLRDLLCICAGRWAVSYYDHPVIRELYAGCRMVEKHTHKAAAGSVGTKRSGNVKPEAVELLIMNY